jgi:hypothetical protein
MTRQVTLPILSDGRTPIAEDVMSVKEARYCIILNVWIGWYALALSLCEAKSLSFFILKRNVDFQIVARIYEICSISLDII